MRPVRGSLSATAAAGRVGFGLDVDLTQDHAMGMVKGGQQMPARVIGRA